MKKNLLTLMFTLSILFTGTVVIEAKNSVKITANQNTKIGKEVNNVGVINRLGGKPVELKKHCFNLCDDWISWSVVVADSMLAACDNNEDSPECKAHQKDVEDTEKKLWKHVRMKVLVLIKVLPVL